MKQNYSMILCAQVLKEHGEGAASPVPVKGRDPNKASLSSNWKDEWNSSGAMNKEF